MTLAESQQSLLPTAHCCCGVRTPLCGARERIGNLRLCGPQIPLAWPLAGGVFSVSHRPQDSSVCPDFFTFYSYVWLPREADSSRSPRLATRFRRTLSLVLTAGLPTFLLCPAHIDSYPELPSPSWLWGQGWVTLLTFPAYQFLGLTMSPSYLSSSTS